MQLKGNYFELFLRGSRYKSVIMQKPFYELVCGKNCFLQRHFQIMIPSPKIVTGNSTPKQIENREALNTIYFSLSFISISLITFSAS